MRALRCPRYSGCLSACIELDGEDFDCSACRHRDDEDTIDVSEIEGCILLLWAIFTPDLWDQARPILYKQRREDNRSDFKRENTEDISIHGLAPDRGASASISSSKPAERG